MSGLLVAGNFFVDRLNAQGQSTGIIGPINTTKLAIKTDADEKVRGSKKKANYGQALSVVKIAKPVEVEWMFDDQPAELIAMALLGDTQVINQGSGDLTDTPLILPTNLRWAQLPQSNFATLGFSVKKDAATLVLGTDYEVNYALGLVRALKGSAVEAGGEVLVTGQHNAISGTLVKGGVNAQVRARLFGEGTNLETGKPIKLDIFDASLSPTSALDFAASEFVSATLAGKAQLVAGKDHPFEYSELDAPTA
ncbi:phage tail tube protein [Shewanella glacialimarina]|uniref:phage tail tube protein n=1 Tax=Shewanella glacialimarina TaxID=2590884 RepID=UPI001CF8077A|nr:hypothetical protein [Shewanella glacialimarina]UCX05425.1 hypothetical protein FJ709_13570 [Shewanella glacialimarina]